MAEKKEMHIENLKKANELITAGVFGSAQTGLSELEKSVASIKSQLEKKLSVMAEERKAQEAEAKRLLEEQAKPEVVKDPKLRKFIKALLLIQLTSPPIVVRNTFVISWVLKTLVMAVGAPMAGLNIRKSLKTLSAL